MSRRRYPAVVIGAGPAGLATSRELARAGVGHVVLEAAQQVGTSWREMFPRFRLNTMKQMSELPGLGYGREVPAFPRRDDYVAYLERYAARFEIQPRFGIRVERVRRRDGRWHVETNDGVYVGASVVVCTGIKSNPWSPEIPGLERFEGRTLHTAEYRGPEPFRGLRVAIVGAGSSAADLASDVAGTAREVTMIVRSGNWIVPETILGLPAPWLLVFAERLAMLAPEAGLTARGVRRLTEALARQQRPFPPPPLGHPTLPVLADALFEQLKSGAVRVREGRIARVGARRVELEDGEPLECDALVLATGFLPVARTILPAAVLEQGWKHFQPMQDRVLVPHCPGLFMVGVRKTAPGALRGIYLDAPHAARWVRRYLAAS